MDQEIQNIQSFEIPEDYNEIRIDKLLSEIYSDQSRTFFQKLIKAGNVTVNEAVVSKPSYLAEADDIVTVKIPKAKSVEIMPEDIPLDILFEDEYLLVVNKPKGMVVHPSPGHYSGTLVNAVMYHCADNLSGINGEIRPGIVHRIDKDTSGTLIVCKNDFAHREIARQIKEHSVIRKYQGIVCGRVREDDGTVQGSIGRHPYQRKKMAVLQNGQGKPAITHYRTLERFEKYTYMEFQLETGRTHQIRVHMASIQHPLMGDDVYGRISASEKQYQGQVLHAIIIGFTHPYTESYMEFSAPLPDYFQTALATLRK